MPQPLTHLQANLTKQIDEIHALQSIFQTEINIFPLFSHQFDAIVEFLSLEHCHQQSTLPFNPITLCVQFLQYSTCLHIYLPFEYPSQYPPIIQQVVLGKRKSTHENTVFSRFLKDEFHQGHEALFQLVESITEWLAENQHDTDDEPAHHNADSAIQPLCLAGIHFHHIYADSKKQAIRKKSAQYNVKGWWKSGKPGRVLILGDQRNVNSWIADIKSLNWQKMVVRVQYASNDVPSQVKEIHWFAHIESDGQLKNEMEKYGLKKVFFELVGLSNEL
uniref:RWD domain-containing protein n=1 Tax=Percolomonas cosmopolitus TaxID=63605 RepID=A0A7S1PFG8_9EUKA|mmetsp:Transcript_11482/g.43095  ORF Transcript_11482/g.43095 Transcript_11482/m.43095 type:complete len:276 (+) Transcript_11482:267-1094(+)|eukprot:CAMPEP_0117449740 /NCGR_PEP_ID=MMETSP0759-20121206/8100_1 /TAXON_ID=63605 /ORGANISM="Percolomonas cosmopolitus, Strain WS" /LENGTH=275 /DNA_ID=CAMNT_0005242223 /DNA_START=200 /DNA_END=1027 /DNA_ORIENTATION=+